MRTWTRAWSAKRSHGGEAREGESGGGADQRNQPSDPAEGSDPENARAGPRVDPYFCPSRPEGGPVFLPEPARGWSRIFARAGPRVDPYFCPSRPEGGPVCSKKPQKIVSGSPRFWPRASESHPEPKKGGRFEVAKRSQNSRGQNGGRFEVAKRSPKKGGRFEVAKRSPNSRWRKPGSF